MIAELADRASSNEQIRGLYSNRETFAARAMCDGVRVRDFEAALLQVLAEIEHRTADKERALWIDNQADIGSWNENVTLSRAIHQIHRVLKTGATAADHRKAQRAVWFPFFLKERRQFARRGFGHLDQPFVADLVIDFGGFRCHWNESAGNERGNFAFLAGFVFAAQDIFFRDCLNLGESGDVRKFLA